MTPGRRRSRPGRRRAVTALGTAYGIGLLAYATLRPRLGDLGTLVELVDDFAPWWYAPVPTTLLAGLGLGSKPLTLAALAAAGAFGLTWGPLFHPATASAAEDGSQLTAMTYNVLRQNRRHAQVARTIAAEDPDVAALQELTPEATEVLVRTLGRRYPYREFRTDPNISGTGLLSRYPIRDVELFQLAEEGVWNQRALFEAPSGPVTVFNVHVPVPRPEWCERPVGPLRLPFRFNVERRRIAVRRLMERIDAVEGPCLVLGDFNMTERSRDYRLVRARLGDAYRAVGGGFGHTFPVVGSFPVSLPAPWPVLRLDYVWHSADFRPLTAHLGRPGGSDHHPVVVRLAPTSSPVVTGEQERVYRAVARPMARRS
jgi:vancomycin resistance protein VanJ